MQIYVNGKLVKAQILPVDKPTLDETLETFSFALISNDQPMPYAPCQNVQVITDSNEKINLFLVTDAVEVYSLSPTKWKHNITCVQNTRKLSKHVVRNTVFSNPSYIQKESYNAVTIALSGREIDPEYEDSQGSMGAGVFGRFSLHRLCRTLNHVSKAVTLSPVNDGYNREKIKNAYLQIDCVGVLNPQTTPGFEIRGEAEWKNDIYNLNDITSRQSSGVIWRSASLILKCQKSNETPHTETITLAQLGVTESEWYLLNTKMKYNRIKELAADGYTKFEVLFPDELSLFFGGRAYPYRSDVWMALSFRVKIIIETYYYNADEILDLLVRRQQKERTIDGRTVKENKLFLLPLDGELHDLLASTPAPNFTFTQCTMYECVAEVFRLFDAIFTMDENGYLGIEYFNDNNGRDVTSTLKKVGQNSSSSEDKYTNGLVAYYQDARTLETFPTDWETTSDGATYATIKTKELGVPESNNSFIFETPHGIDSMINFYIKVLNAGVANNKISFHSNFYINNSTSQYLVWGADVDRPMSGFPKLDISHYVVYKDYWTLLDVINSMYVDYYLEDPTQLLQINTVFFERGSNQIDVSYTYNRYWFGVTQFALDNAINCELWSLMGAYHLHDPAVPSGDQNDKLIANFHGILGRWDQVSAKMRYLTTVDGRTKIESLERKYDGETLIDQYNGAVDLNKMGLNILGLSLKLGNPTLTVTQKITQWENRIKQGDIYNYQGKMWIANVVNYTILGSGYVQATIQFVQNFNNLAMRTKLLREKRMSNVSSELTIKSEENILEYVYFTVTGKSNDMPSNFDDTDSISMNRDTLAYDLAASLGSLSTAHTIDSASFRNNSLSYTCYLPMIKYGAGNSICFETSYDNPMSAGKQTKGYDAGWFLSAQTKYFTKSIYYTDDIGFATIAHVEFFSSDGIAITDNFPSIITGIAPRIRLLNIGLFKQPNETFALNYQLCFLPYEKDKDFIGSKFINENFFVNSTRRKATDLRLYFNNVQKYSVLDTKGVGMWTGINNTTIYHNDFDGIEIRLTCDGSVEANYFAVCDTDGNILFASNRGISGNTIHLVFTTRTERIDAKILSDL